MGWGSLRARVLHSMDSSVFTHLRSLSLCYLYFFFSLTHIHTESHMKERERENEKQLFINSVLDVNRFLAFKCMCTCVRACTLRVDACVRVSQTGNAV